VLFEQVCREALIFLLVEPEAEGVDEYGSVLPVDGEGAQVGDADRLGVPGGLGDL
jgi:hypothetical protein